MCPLRELAFGMQKAELCWMYSRAKMPGTVAGIWMYQGGGLSLQGCVCMAGVHTLLSGLCRSERSFVFLARASLLSLQSPAREIETGKWQVQIGFCQFLDASETRWQGGLFYENCRPRLEETGSNPAVTQLGY